MSVFLCPTSWKGREILRDLFTRRGWNVMEDPEVLEADPPCLDLAWCAGRDVPWKHVLEGKMRASVHHLKTGLNRKADMHEMLAKYVKRNRDSVLATSLPETHVLDLNEIEEDDEKLEDVLTELKEQLRGCAELWVLKASESNRGMDVHLFAHGDIAGPGMLDKMTQTQCRVWLLQQCVDPPLLFRNRKFHMRVVVLAAGDLAVHVHENVVVIPAHSSFARNKDGVVDRFSFLTNHCVQHSHSDYEAGKFALLRDLCDAIAASRGMPPDCSSAEELEQRIFEQIKRIVGEVFAATKLSPTSFFPLVSCFELFGCDFLMDDALNVFLLEINSDPSMSLYEGSHLEPKLVQILDDTLNIAVGPPSAPRTAEGAARAVGAAPRRSTWGEWWDKNGDVSSVYVGGVPYLHAHGSAVAAVNGAHGKDGGAAQRGSDRAGAGGQGADAKTELGAEVGEGDGRADVVGGFHCVHRRAPRYEGMGGLKVFRGLLRTTLAMQETCAGKRTHSAQHGGQSERSSRQGAVLTASVSGYAWYAAEAREAVAKALPGVGVVGGSEGVGAWAVQLGPYRDIQWEEVLARGMVCNHYMARRALLSRVSLYMSAAQGGGGRDGGGGVPLTLRVGAESERQGWMGEVSQLMEQAGSGWRVEGMGSGSGEAQVRLCRTADEVRSVMQEEGEAASKRSWTIQQWVPPVRAHVCRVELPVLAVGKLAAFVLSDPLARVEGEAGGGEREMSLREVAALLGAGRGEEASRWAEAWTAKMEQTVRAVWAGAMARKAEVLLLPHCFELFAFSFLLGPSALRLHTMTSSSSAGSTPAASHAPQEDGPAVCPWLVRVRPAMEADPLWRCPGQQSVEAAALELALGTVQWPQGVPARRGAEVGEGSRFRLVFEAEAQAPPPSS